jgi:hypothetical protein
MKNSIILMIASLFLSMSAYGATGLQCSSLDVNFEEWSIEIVRDNLAFFDNDTWSQASYVYSMNAINPIDVYSSIDSSDPFKVEVRKEEDNQIARIIFTDTDSQLQAVEFNCVRTSDLLYF